MLPTPSAHKSANPYATPSANPYATPSANPYAHKNANPYANPFATPSTRKNVKSVPFSLLLAENINPSENPFTHNPLPRRIGKPRENDVLNMTKSYDLNDVKQKAHTDKEITDTKINRLVFVRKKIIEAMKRLESFIKDACSRDEDFEKEYHEIIKYINTFIINSLRIFYENDTAVKKAFYFFKREFSRTGYSKSLDETCARTISYAEASQGKLRNLLTFVDKESSELPYFGGRNKRSKNNRKGQNTKVFKLRTKKNKRY
jgi:hypothetical protein